MRLVVRHRCSSRSGDDCLNLFNRAKLFDDLFDGSVNRIGEALVFGALLAVGVYGGRKQVVDRLALEVKGVAGELGFEAQLFLEDEYRQAPRFDVLRITRARALDVRRSYLAGSRGFFDH